MDPKPEHPDDTEVSGRSGPVEPGPGPPSSAQRREPVSSKRAPPSAESGSSLEGFPRPIEPRSFPAARITFGPEIALARLPVVPRQAYTIGGDVASGGVGRVLRARDERLGRPVALKEMRFDPAGPDAERFVREVMITAKLQHPSIVTLYEAGRWPSGEPFYAMELVNGRSLADVIAEKKALEERLALLPHVVDAADAVAYAHSRGILHRDLKPGNVLVGSFGETVVIDWGLAKDCSGKDAVPEPGARPAAGWGLDPPDTLTMAGAVLGTPAYMPPEQAAGRPVDVRADVYALGALIYHLVAGSPPYEGRTPMRVIRKVLEGPPTPLESRQPELPPELGSIVQKAMAREPEGRYPTARAFADDLRRFSNGQKVSAHAYSPLERLHRFTSRYRATVLVAAGAFVLLVITGALGFWRVLAARDEAHTRMRQAEAAQGEALRRADDLTLVEARAQAGRDPTRAVAWLRTLSPRFDRWPAARVIAEDARAHGIATVTAAHAFAVNDLAFSGDGRLLATSSDDRTLRVWDLAAEKSTVVEGHTDETWNLLFLRDGRTLASAGKDRTIRLTNLETWQGRALAGHEGPVTSIAGSSDGRLLVSGSFDRTLRIWDTVTGESWALRGSGDEVRAVALSSDRRKVASGRLDGTVQFWDLDRGNERTLGRLEAPVLQLAFSVDDRILVAALWNGAVHALRTEQGPPWGAPPDRLLSGPIRGYQPTSYHALASSRDGKLLVFAREEGVAVVDADTLATGETPQSPWGPRPQTAAPPQALAERTLRAPDERFTSVAISPDQRLVAAGSANHAVRVWDLGTGASHTLHGFAGNGVLVAFSPDGRFLAAAGSSDAAVRLHPVQEQALSVAAHPGGATSARLSPDGKLLVTAGRDGAGRIWALSPGRPGDPGSHPALDCTVAVLEGHHGATVVALAPGGLVLATAGEDGSVRVWDTGGRLLRTFESRPGKSPLVLFSPDGKLVAYPGAGDSVRLAEVDTGVARTLPGQRGAVEALAFSPRGEALASAGQDGVVRLWDTAVRPGPASAKPFAGHTGAVTAVAFSPDGATLLSGGKDHTLRFWAVGGGEARTVAVGGGGVQRVLFTRDGRTVLYTSVLESIVHLMDAATGRDAGALVGHEGDILSIALSPDETRIAAATTQGMVRLWDRRTGESRTVPGHAGGAREVAFSPDARFVVSAGEDGAVRFWADDLPEDPSALRAWLAAAGGAGAAALLDAPASP